MSRPPPLTPEQTTEIRAWAANGRPQRKIAAHFGIQQGTVSRVLSGQLHPPEEEWNPYLAETLKDAFEALRFYARGGVDGGRRAHHALELYGAGRRSSATATGSPA